MAAGRPIFIHAYCFGLLQCGNKQEFMEEMLVFGVQKR
jgi:hypothetical protein